MRQDSGAFFPPLSRRSRTDASDGSASLARLQFCHRHLDSGKRKLLALATVNPTGRMIAYLQGPHYLESAPYVTI